MTLKKRLDRLEGAPVKPEARVCAIVRKIVQPSATGPELVGLMLRPLQCCDKLAGFLKMVDVSKLAWSC